MHYAHGHCSLFVYLLLQEDGWDTEPFVLVEKDEKLYGRGSTDDKGPVIGWIHAVEAFQKTGQDVPVNIKVRFLNQIEDKIVMDVSSI